jgi:hypothetical protein
MPRQQLGAMRNTNAPFYCHTTDALARSSCYSLLKQETYFLSSGNIFPLASPDSLENEKLPHYNWKHTSGYVTIKTNTRRDINKWKG